MDDNLQSYIDSLEPGSVPWGRMLTFYGTAEDYGRALCDFEQTLDVFDAKELWNTISGFEHQSTMLPPAPFALVFLVRILKKLLVSNARTAELIAGKLIDAFIYYAEVCRDADECEHAEPLSSLSDMLDEKYLLPEEFDEDYLDEVYEDENAIPDDLFYSCYYYSKQILSQVPSILDHSGKFAKESKKLKKLLLI